ncbi:MAG: exonuclease SbcCD subunit D [Dehalococcoidia bacterium]
MKIIHFADLHLGVENYGKIDPATGLSTRLIDFLTAFDQLVDYALENKADLVLFCGDAYKTREPSQTQQREFAKRINRLATGDIPVFLLTGNHDMPNAVGRATATEIFDTLAVKNVYVANRPDVHTINTAGGNIQIVSLPWLRRSALLNRDEIRNLTLPEITQKLQETLTNIISSLVEKLDPGIPAILAAHVWVTGSKVGSESMMSIGQEHTLLLSNVALPAFDYVALGHIHKQQVLNENPPVVYSGSLERVDFGEENDEKGFYVIDIESGTGGDRRVSFEFHSVKARDFLTLKVELEADDINPTATLLNTVSAQQEKIKDAIVRLNVTLPAQIQGQLSGNEIREALKEAAYFTIAQDIQRETRLRMGERNAEEIAPLEALKAYLDSKDIPAERQRVLLEYGENLIDSAEES